MVKGFAKGSILVCLLAITGCQNPSINKSSHALTAESQAPANSDVYRQLTKRPGAAGTRAIGRADVKHYEDTGDCSTGPFNLKDLKVAEIRVSNHDLQTVANSLGAMGYQVQSINSQQPIQVKQYSCEQLPVIVIQPPPIELKVTFSDDAESVVGQMGHSNAGELDSFLAYYHPRHEQQFNKLKWLVEKKLDRPSAQVYIETMVLEVREEDSEEFGIAYQKGSGDRLLSLGSLVPGGDTLGFIKDTFTDPDTGLQVFTPGIGKRLQIKALIDEGKAEVLSRPSVLAISNRQAVIQIVDVIQTPELSSTLSESGNVQISAYKFTALPIGITLNLKPRVSANRDWLTLEIDATVESEDDENTGKVFAATETGDQVLLAEKKGSSSKKVRTFARIPDRTPIIIGGLVSKSSEVRESKVPLLGSIPILGKLFTTSDEEIQKREIIIVLTPYILDEDRIGIASNQPSNSVQARLSDSLLFENRYRIKNDDLFDLSFFEGDVMHQQYKAMFQQLVRKDPGLYSHPDFYAFKEDFLPGSEHLLHKVIFDIISRSSRASQIRNEQITVHLANNEKMNLQALIEDMQDDPNAALQITQPTSAELTLLGDPPVGYQASTGNIIRLDDEQDIERLKNAILVQQIIAYNDNDMGLTLKDLYPGKAIIYPPQIKQKQFVVDGKTLETYQGAQVYYQLMMAEVERVYATIDEMSAARLEDQAVSVDYRSID